MKRYKKYAGIFSLSFIVLLTYNCNAQDSGSYQDITIYVHVGVETGVTLPKNFIDLKFAKPSQENSLKFYKLGYDPDTKSFTIKANEKNPDAGLLVARYDDGTQNITVLYQDKFAAGDEVNFVYDFSIQESDNSSSVPNITLQLQREATKTLESQREPIGISREEIGKNYPGNKFAEYPAGQTINLAMAETEESKKACNDLLDAEPSLNLSYSTNLVTTSLVCQGISFSGANDAYLKILIQNGGNDNLLVGVMLLTIKRKDGTRIKLHPGYLHPTKYPPIILSGKQRTIIYPFKAYDVSNDDELIFELHDRQRKTNIEISIPGKIYNKEKDRAL